MSKLNPEEEFKHMANEFSDIQLLEESTCRKHWFELQNVWGGMHIY